MTRIYTFLLLLTLTLSISCTRTDVEPDIVPTIDDEFTLHPWEVLNEDGNKLTLQLETIALQECLNHEIIHSVDIANQKIRVELNGIDTPIDCQAGESPAKASIELGNLTTGNYDVEIVILDLIMNNGTVEVSEDFFKIEMDTNDGIQISNSEIRRVPEHTFWGYMALDDTALPFLATGFLTQLTILADQSVFAGGEYGHFKLSPDASEIEMDIETTYPDTHKFIFKYSGDQEDLKKLVTDYRDDPIFGDKLEINLKSYQGEEL